MLARLITAGILLVTAPASAAEGELLLRQWMVDGAPRRALIHLPSPETKDVPLVFVFHGHGGTARKAAEMFRMHDHWPQAVVIYMQGLPSPVPGLDPKGERPGWQGKAGQLGDRDLHFFDAVLKAMRNQFPSDDRKVFCTGFSQGGVFAYLLWAERGRELAAVAAGGAIASPDKVARFQPKPVMHVAGTKDDIIKFPKQQRTIENLIQVNHCDKQGQKLSDHQTRYADADNKSPVLTFIHEGGHELPADAAAAIASFLKRRAAIATTQAADR